MINLACGQKPIYPTVQTVRSHRGYADVCVNAFLSHRKAEAYFHEPLRSTTATSLIVVFMGISGSLSSHAKNGLTEWYGHVRLIKGIYNHLITHTKDDTNQGFQK